MWAHQAHSLNVFNNKNKTFKHLECRVSILESDTTEFGKGTVKGLLTRLMFKNSQHENQIKMSKILNMIRSSV